MTRTAPFAPGSPGASGSIESDWKIWVRGSQFMAGALRGPGLPPDPVRLSWELPHNHEKGFA